MRFTVNSWGRRSTGSGKNLTDIDTDKTANIGKERKEVDTELIFNPSVQKKDYKRLSSLFGTTGEKWNWSFTREN